MFIWTRVLAIQPHIIANNAQSQAIKPVGASPIDSVVDDLSLNYFSTIGANAPRCCSSCTMTCLDISTYPTTAPIFARRASQARDAIPTIFVLQSVANVLGGTAMPKVDDEDTVPPSSYTGISEESMNAHLGINAPATNHFSGMPSPSTTDTGVTSTVRITFAGTQTSTIVVSESGDDERTDTCYSNSGTIAADATTISYYQPDTFSSPYRGSTLTTKLSQSSDSSPTYASGISISYTTIRPNGTPCQSTSIKGGTPSSIPSVNPTDVASTKAIDPIPAPSESIMALPFVLTTLSLDMLIPKDTDASPSESASSPTLSLVTITLPTSTITASIITTFCRTSTGLGEFNPPSNDSFIPLPPQITVSVCTVQACQEEKCWISETTGPVGTNLVVFSTDGEKSVTIPSAGLGLRFTTSTTSLTTTLYVTETKADAGPASTASDESGCGRGTGSPTITVTMTTTTFTTLPDSVRYTTLSSTSADPSCVLPDSMSNSSREPSSNSITNTSQGCDATSTTNSNTVISPTFSEPIPTIQTIRHSGTENSFNTIITSTNSRSSKSTATITSTITLISYPAPTLESSSLSLDRSTTVSPCVSVTDTSVSHPSTPEVSSAGLHGCIAASTSSVHSDLGADTASALSYYSSNISLLVSRSSLASSDAGVGTDTDPGTASTTVPLSTDHNPSPSTVISTSGGFVTVIPIPLPLPTSSSASTLPSSSGTGTSTDTDIGSSSPVAALTHAPAVSELTPTTLKTVFVRGGSGGERGHG